MWRSLPHHLAPRRRRCSATSAAGPVTCAHGTSSTHVRSFAVLQCLSCCHSHEPINITKEVQLKTCRSSPGLAPAPYNQRPGAHEAQQHNLTRLTTQDICSTSLPAVFLAQTQQQDKQWKLCMHPSSVAFATCLQQPRGRPAGWQTRTCMRPLSMKLAVSANASSSSRCVTHSAVTCGPRKRSPPRPSQLARPQQAGNCRTGRPAKPGQCMAHSMASRSRTAAQPAPRPSDAPAHACAGRGSPWQSSRKRRGRVGPPAGRPPVRARPRTRARPPARRAGPRRPGRWSARPAAAPGARVRPNPNPIVAVHVHGGQQQHLARARAPARAPGPGRAGGVCAANVGCPQRALAAHWLPHATPCSHCSTSGALAATQVASLRSVAGCGAKHSVSCRSPFIRARTLGICASAPAIAQRCRCPPLSVCVGRCATSARPTAASAAATCARAASAGRAYLPAAVMSTVGIAN